MSNVGNPHFCDGHYDKVPLARKLLRKGVPFKDVAKAIGMTTEGARGLLRRYEVRLPDRRRG